MDLVVRLADVGVDRELVALSVEQDRVVAGDQSVGLADERGPRVLIDEAADHRRVAEEMLPPPLPRAEAGPNSRFR